MTIEKVPVMTRWERNYYLFITGFGYGLTAIFGIWWFGAGHIPGNFGGVAHIADYLLFMLLSYVVWYQIIIEVFAWIVATYMKKPLFMHPEAGKKVAFITTFVPGKEPIDVLARTLKAIVAVEYPHDSWLLDEGNDPIARDLCRKLKVKHFSRKGIEKYNMPEGKFKMKTKGGNHNAWHDLYGINYDYVAQVDVDFAPNKNFLTRTLGYFRDPDVSFVGTPQIYGNQGKSWISRGAAEQAFNFYGHLQRGFYGHDMPLFIGANHVIRTKAHMHIGGYSGHIVEDHLTGMKFYAHHWKGVYVAEILAVGEGPETWESYFSQQMRWSYGLFHILLHYSFRHFTRMRLRQIFNFFLIQQYYFYGPAQAIAVFLLTIYFLFGIQSTSMILTELLVLYVPLILVQLGIGFWLQRFNVDHKSESGLLLKGRILALSAWPIYFLAFVKVVTGQKLSYKVTPKGGLQKEYTRVSLFTPHLVLGTLTAVDIIVSFFTHHQAIQLVFFAIFNTVAMYGFVLVAYRKRLSEIFDEKFPVRTLGRFHGFNRSTLAK